MPDLPQLPRVDLAAAITRAADAHALVLTGIATHAEKERARRQAAYHQREAERALRGGPGPASGQLRALPSGHCPGQSRTVARHRVRITLAALRDHSHSAGYHARPG